MDRQLQNILIRSGLAESLNIINEEKSHRDFSSIYGIKTSVKKLAIQGENKVLKSTINNIIDYSKGKTNFTPVAESFSYRDLLTDNNLVVGAEKVLGVGKSSELAFLGKPREKVRKIIARSSGLTPTNMTDKMDKFEKFNVIYDDKDVCKAVELLEGTYQSLTGKDKIIIGEDVEKFKNKMKGFLGRTLVEKPNEFYDRRNDLHIRIKNDKIHSIYLEIDPNNTKEKKVDNIQRYLKLAMTALMLGATAKVAYGTYKTGRNIDRFGKNIGKVNDAVEKADVGAFMDFGAKVMQNFRDHRANRSRPGDNAQDVTGSQ